MTLLPVQVVAQYGMFPVPPPPLPAPLSQVTLSTKYI